MIEDSHSFVYGVVAGVVFMFGVGWFSNQIRKKRFVATKPSRKVTAQGIETANEIISKAVRARTCMTFYTLVILLAFAALAVFLFWAWNQV